MAVRGAGARARGGGRDSRLAAVALVLDSSKSSTWTQPMDSGWGWGQGYVSCTRMMMIDFTVHRRSARPMIAVHHNMYSYTQKSCTDNVITGP